jgi:transforming growth factor-beta-induced protein
MPTDCGRAACNISRAICIQPPVVVRKYGITHYLRGTNIIMRSRIIRTLAALLALTFIAAACSDDDDAAESESTTTEAMAEDEGTTEEAGTIVEVATAAGDFTTLVAAADAAGLVETLSGEGPFTVFAPTDDAFAAALADLDLTAEELLADTELLTSVLTYHVVAGEVLSTDVVTMDGESVVTVNGAEITIGVDGETVTVNEATVIAVDIDASNGVIHVIDAVLLPPA